MSTIQRGVVDSIHERKWATDMLYSFKLECFPDRYWKMGKEVPAFRKGDHIQFEEANGTLVSEATIVAPSDSAQTPPPQTPDVPTNDIGKRIRYQAARADATRLVVAALHTEALPWTAVQQKNKSKKLDLLVKYVKQVTET